MKFDFGSDLHLAFDAGNDRILSSFPKEPSPTLILAGDIAEVTELKSKKGKHHDLFFKFFEYCSKTYKHVAYVFGNHEFYDAELNFAIRNARSIFRQRGFDNIHILENDTLDVGDALIFGATMWTSFRNGNATLMNDAPSLMQDYQFIRWVDQYKERSKIIPEMIYACHRNTMRALDRFNSASSTKPKIVVTHHAPHYLSIDPCYRSMVSSHLYYEELFDMVYSSDFKIWIHGHTHDPSDYTINNTRIVANPRGYYGYETVAHSWAIKTIDMGEENVSE
ncbi:Calcineurin-like phosphoesterase domain, ApaH type [uncultured Caudovirales phage]|uniref:Calcineurin-like phosphoesterase domain, ApaH type n=1 Tax=uncultured Caudovirales phage TaxID=2100421 RepID=A0A6J5L7H0_9CAUD|nr:Calcineurin-like phosphoesterase domain, ApaH type [uncultured Caudovirales phage]